MARDPDDILDEHYTECFHASLDHRFLHRSVLYPETMPIVAEGGDETKDQPKEGGDHDAR